MAPDNFVAAEPEPLKAGKAPEFRRDGARQIVGVEVHLLQAAEIAEFRRDGARQVVLSRGSDL